MFQTEEIIGIKHSNGNVTNIKEENNLLLLLPATINDTIAKINNHLYKWMDYKEEIVFHNNYAVLILNKKILCIDGSYNYIDKEQIQDIITPFSCGYAIARLSYEYKYHYAFVSTLGKVCYISNNKEDLKEFKEGFAVVKTSDGWQYLDTNFQMSDEKYLEASSFHNNIAICKTYENDWVIINHNQEVLQTYKNNPHIDIVMHQAVKKFDDNTYTENKVKYEYKNIPGISNELYIIDEETGLSIFADDFLMSLARKLNIKIEGNTTNEKLIEIVTKASQKGNYVYDFSEKEVREIEVVLGVKISDRTKTITSFDEEDVLMVKNRKKG